MPLLLVLPINGGSAEGGSLVDHRGTPTPIVQLNTPGDQGGCSGGGKSVWGIGRDGLEGTVCSTSVPGQARDAATRGVQESARAGWRLIV